MLTRLQVSNFAIIDRVEVEFEPSMTVLTGETGAGKSILVDALGLVLGDRGSAQLVRPGAKRAEFSAEFDVSDLPAVRDWLVEHSLDVEDECLLRRVIGADGRSRAFINGNPVPVQQLKSVGEMLVDIHGQHFHQSLGRRAVQRELLDYFGELGDDAGAVSDAFGAWRELRDRLAQLVDDDSERASRLDLLSFQLEELRTLDLRSGEFAELRAERQRLANSGRLADGVRGALDALFDDEAANANALIAAGSRELEALVEADESLSPIVELVESAGIQVAEAVDELRRYADDIDMDPARQEQVEERLDDIRTLARKHRVEPEELNEFVERLEGERDELLNADERGQELERDVERARERFLELADALSSRRRKAAAGLGERVTEAMQDLGMPGGRFEVAIGRLDEEAARSHGLDDVAFMISANPGQPPMPLSKVASGGELSRMSLSIQVILSGGSSIPTMVFDEVDSGVGGGVAEMVGRRLAELSSARQVLCVTHLPQVASLAANHFRIAKVSDGKATRTKVQGLGKEERIEELARMLGGVEITKKTLEHAAEMLAGAPQKRA